MLCAVSQPAHRHVVAACLKPCGIACPGSPRVRGINGNVAYAGPHQRYTQVYDKIGLTFSDILRELSPDASNAVPRVHTWTDGLSELFLKATVADGARLLDDPDDDFFGASPLHVNTRWGLRHNHLEAFYRQAKKSKLTIVQGTAKELIFTDSRVSGVVLVDGVEIHAQEIIVSAGAIGSPPLLLQSGIGDSPKLLFRNRTCLDLAWDTRIAI